MPRPASVHEYDPEVHPLAALVRHHLGGVPLAYIHRTESVNGRAPAGQDNSSPLHKRAYAIWTAIAPAYRHFMKTVVLPQFPPGTYYYQRVPTFRFHVPGGLATGEFHRDRDYSHPPETINVLVPLTRMHESGSMWLESAPDVGDFAPVDLHVGQYLVFDGANCRHGSYPNKTGRTRVSFDARVCPADALPTDGRKTRAAGILMSPGRYYCAIPVTVPA